MNDVIAKLRQRYRPERIKLLLVAESPPESHDEEVRFFYNPRQERFDHLYRSVMKALFPEFEHRPREKDHWLRKFQRHGYFLIDATDQPVNRLQPALRRRILNTLSVEEHDSCLSLNRSCLDPTALLNAASAFRACMIGLMNGSSRNCS